MKRILAILIFASAALSVATAQRLPEVATPENYKLIFTPNLETATFEGDETISIRVLKPTSEIMLTRRTSISTRRQLAAAARRKKFPEPATKKRSGSARGREAVGRGTATIHITYAGILNDEMRGFYLGKDDQGRKYAATQFEATDARRAFPSFDEPAYKATFDISAVADKGQVAISNQRLPPIRPVRRQAHGTLRHYAKMSSYLAALVVGNFEYIEGEADGIPIRVYSTPGKKEMGKFALEAAEHVLSYYDKYFSIKYPYGKLDLIGLPDFSAGADGEHWLHHIPRSDFTDRRETGFFRIEEGNRFRDRP